MATKSKQYVIIRTEKAGVFAGHLKSRKGQEVVLDNCRRIWYWSGAASLSQLALDGTADPGNCKFPAPVNGHLIYGMIEIIPVTQKAQKSIESVPIWKK